ncbi:MAG: MBL fold metallo-hydrolase [Candidatus Yanofskybacteria bacterium]|nr:MBL fold metallo-hydrolase [Candidatus Yanofskybacteria bacterium]
MSAVSFESWGSADTIGPSCQTLRFGDFRVGIDFGAGMKGDQRAPIINGKLDALFVTHGHMDHHGMVPCALREWPNLPVWATVETKQFMAWAWYDQLRICESDGKEPPFTSDEADRALRRTRVMSVGTTIQLAEDLTVTPYHAGHILGAVSLLFCYRGEYIFVTGDTGLRDHWFVPGAKPPTLDRCALLVRESTYAGLQWEQTRDEIEDDLVGAVLEVLCGGGRVVIPTLAIDRMPNVYRILQRACVGKDWPVWVSGGVEPTNIYARFAPEASWLGAVNRFASSRHERQALYSRGPFVVIASSGMVMPRTPSHRWVTAVIRDLRSAIFMVNYQDPTAPGGLILKSKLGERIELEPGSGHTRQRLCKVQRFDLSTHAKEDEMAELERMLNPDLVAHVHGEGDRIQSFIDAQTSGPQRVRTRVGQEIKL